jgi:DNA mismatch repair protein MutS
MMSKLTPMLKQYLEIKEKYQDAILFFRMGDFYEMFFEDAEVASKTLRITLTSRNKHDEQPIPMCGVPHHSAASYIATLIDQGFKVALCDQMEDPSEAQGIVKREVTRVITPGTVIDLENLDAKSNNYLASIGSDQDRLGLAYVDITTGEFQAVSFSDENDLYSEVLRIAPREMVLPQGIKVVFDQQRLKNLTQLMYTNWVEDDSFALDRGYRALTDQFSVDTLHGYGCEDKPEIVRAAGALLEYVKTNQIGFASHITDLAVYQLSDTMIVDEITKRNLELVESHIRKGLKGSLLGLLDHTETAMGGRMLRHWLCYPLIQIREIQLRSQAVEELKENPSLRAQLREDLKRISDLERLNGKVVLGHANARDLVALKESLRHLPRVKQILEKVQSVKVHDLVSALDPLDDVGGLIDRAVVDEPPISLRDGGIIRQGYHEELDKYIVAARDGKSWIAGLEAKERERTRINSLKVGFNRVFGYYIEITKANLSLVPPDYIRKQTLVNGERYITEELKKYETLVLEAQEKRFDLEYELFLSVRTAVAQHHRRIKEAAVIIAELDVLTSLAHVAHKNNYVRPEVYDGPEIHITEGRHPVVEQNLTANTFVPNDLHLDNEKEQILIITGPNMSGKSTILRQAALIVLMAQMGSFVPAAGARIGVVDRIFTRVGAMDDIFKGQSTFMVEMIETSHIVHQSTPSSLVILDEIGRGTSTFDGLSIAWAVAEYLHDHRGRGVKTLFATHYHELTQLAEIKPRVINYNVAVKEWNDRVIFLRRLRKGGSSHSYGIQVARLAGLPKTIIDRSREILNSLERGKFEEVGKRTGGESTPATQVQLSLFHPGDDAIRKRLNEVDVNTITPLEALTILNELKTL